MTSPDSTNEQGAKPPSAPNNPDLTLTAPPTKKNPFLPIPAEARRLYWGLDGPLSTSIWVMPQGFYDPDAALEPYVRAGPEDNASELHPVSWAALTNPRVSSVTVSVGALND